VRAFVVRDEVQHGLVITFAIMGVFFLTIVDAQKDAAFMSNVRVSV